MGKDNQTHSPVKDRDVGGIEHKRIGEPAARHIEEIRNRAVNQPVDHIAKRATDQQPGRDFMPKPARLAPYPPKDNRDDDQSDGNQRPTV